MCHPERRRLGFEPPESKAPYRHQGRAGLRPCVPRPRYACQPERRNLRFLYGAPSWRTALWPLAEWKGSVTRPGRWPEGQLYLLHCHPEQRRLGFEPPESKDPYSRHSLPNCHPERSPHSLLNCHPERSPLRAESRDLRFPRRTEYVAARASGWRRSARDTRDDAAPHRRSGRCLTCRCSGRCSGCEIR
jgi:hypothetical protein